MNTNENKPLVSIIIPCYNQQNYIEQTLDSVKAQTYPNWECIIVNDGSTDDSLNVINKYVASDHRFVVIDKINEGVSIARNAAISSAKGEYILPLDGDDIITPPYISLAINHLQAYTQTKLVYCKAAFIGDREGGWNLPSYQYSDLKWENCIFCSAIYRRSDFEKTSGYNPNMKHGLEDWDFWLSFLNENDEVYQIPEICFYYRKHGTTRNSEAIQQSNETYGQLVLNHLPLYRPYLRNLFLYKQEMNFYKDEYERISSSPSYKLGRLILAPLRFLKSKISKA